MIKVSAMSQCLTPVSFAYALHALSLLYLLLSDLIFFRLINMFNTWL